MTTSTAPKPPKHLSLAARRWFTDISTEYELGSHHVKLLVAAAESWDLCAKATAAIAKHGLTYEDRFGAPRPRPEVAIARDARAAFVSCVRALGLDLQPPVDDGQE